MQTQPALSQEYRVYHKRIPDCTCRTINKRIPDCTCMKPAELPVQTNLAEEGTCRWEHVPEYSTLATSKLCELEWPEPRLKVQRYEFSRA